MHPRLSTIGRMRPFAAPVSKQRSTNISGDVYPFVLFRSRRLFLILLMTYYLAAGCAFHPSPQSLFRNSDDTPPTASHFSLAGEWKFRPAAELSSTDAHAPQFDDAAWRTMPVPSNWFLHGEEMHGVVWFRKRFETPAAVGNGRTVATLRFEAVDYAADVWLNGHRLGSHEGYFAPFSFDVTDLLKPDGDNLLAVRVDSPREPESDWSLRKRLIKGVLNHHDTRPGGAWSARGQEGNTGGIWGPVTLHLSRKLHINKIAVVQNLRVAKKRATPVARVHLVLPKNRDRSLGKVRFHARLAPANYTPSLGEPSRFDVSAEKRLRPGKEALELRFSDIPVRLWHPWDYGEPNLYDLTVTALSKGGEVLDRRTETVGFRTVACDAETRVWRLNGRRVFLRGTNYIASQWMSEMTEDRFRHDLMLMKRANVNAVRVHAHVSARDFYRMCDRVGILVWQDFPLQWGYADTPEMVHKASRQASEMVDMLAGHPSIIAWCGHNEPPWAAEWMAYKYPDYDPDQNRALDDALYETLKAADPTRYVHKASLTAEHPWLGWYSGSWRDYAQPARHPPHQMITEFGAQALPHLDTLRTIIPPDALWPETDADWAIWDYRNFQKRETFDIASVAKGETIHDFIRNTQEYQARLIQYAAESYRRQRFSPVTAIFHFMFNETWPSINWGVVDFTRLPKPGYGALRTAYQPLLPSIEYDREVWDAGAPVAMRLWVVNDLHRDFGELTLAWALNRDTGEAVSSGKRDVTVQADTTRSALELKWRRLAPGGYRLSAFLYDSNRRIAADNAVMFRVRPVEE